MISVNVKGNNIEYKISTTQPFITLYIIIPIIILGILIFFIYQRKNRKPEEIEEEVEIFRQDYLL